MVAAKNGAAVLAALALAAPLASAPPPLATASFVVARGGQLLEDGRPFRFLSLDVPNLHYVEDDLRFERAMPFRLPDEYEIEDALESIRQIGGRVVRTYTLSVRKASDPAGLPRHVLGPGRFEEAAFVALDTVLDVARRKDVRVIVPLVDNWSWWGGISEYAAFRGKGREAFWTDPQLIADFEATVRFVLTRVNTRNGVAYRDDPTVLAWETGNELECPRAWTHRIATFIKSLDRSHLVVDGTRAEVLRRDAVEEPATDFLQTHHYEKDAGAMVAHIRESAALARGRKPYHVGEFGFLPTTGMTAVMDAIVESGAAGGLVWSLRPHSRDGGFYWHSEPSGGGVKAYHWPGFASGDAYDERRLLAELRRRAYAIRGLATPEPEPPAPPSVIAVTPGGLVAWRGSAGAGAYDVERSEAPAGPWTIVGRGVSDADAPYRPPFCDEAVKPGRSYLYRVVARNEAGSSAPSQPLGPVAITHRTLVDELASGAQIARMRGRLAFRTDEPRRFREDANGVEGEAGSEIVYETGGPLVGGRAWAFAERAGDRLSFAASRDGAKFQAVAPAVRTVAPGEAATYGYRIPVVYDLEAVPAGSRFLRIGLRPGVRLARVELDFGEEGTMGETALRSAIEGELRDNLLPFWRTRSVDAAKGGFIGEMSNEGVVRPDAEKGLVLNARYLWTFAALYRHLRDPRDLELARRAYDYLEANFRDPEHGGYAWRVDAGGRATDRSKKIYGQAFCIYALSEYHLATGEPRALDAARELYGLVERHARDASFAGYIETRARDWSPTADLRLSDGDMNAPKSMNTHLHVLEAYTNLFRAWPDPGLAARLRELVELFGRHIIERPGEPRASHLRHFFDERWRPLSGTYTYGHDIEASWLLEEAAEALGDEKLAAEVRRWSVGLARSVLAEAVGPDGGIAYEGRDGTVIDGNRDWWCEAEAVTGFWHAYSVTGDAAFSRAAAGVWALIAGRMADRVHGDWFWRVRADGSVDTGLPKVSEWKCPYHNVRMCLEMMRRLGDGPRGRS